MFVYSRLICLDNQSPLTNVFKLFRVVYRLRRTIYNGFIVVNQIKQHCRINFRRLPRELPKQKQRFVRLRPLKSYRGTAEANNVFLASASTIILTTAFELKFERCTLKAGVQRLRARVRRLKARFEATIPRVK